ncbi:hypothetical protein FRB94_007514 [Tulasnella sp. JGI-2019a]|nr:hypothetical protein FRB93_007131 [Tulasnella sp. JGI-2019a]KAG8997683.1 hypothetical protein FRB94_007514 [Tulasnella sp. JGI-2019a]
MDALTFSFLLVPIIWSPPLAQASPSSLLRRQNDNADTTGSGGGGMSAGLWAPIIIVPIVVIGALIYFRSAVVSNLSVFSPLGDPSAVTAGRPAGAQDPTTLTAEQLMAGGTGATGGTSATLATAPTRTASATRRARRRPRRTPSQVSVKSLPAYNLEAGEQEMVLVRPRHDDVDQMERMPEESNEHEHDEDIEVSTPLLAGPSDSSRMPQSQSETHTRGESIGSTAESVIRQSMDSRMTASNDTHDTTRSSMSLLERERGLAPAYFEVVEQPNGGAGQGHSNTNDNSNTASARAGPSPARLPSAFRRFMPWFSSNTQEPVLPTVMQQLPASQSQVSIGNPSLMSAAGSSPANSSALHLVPTRSHTRSRSNSQNPSASTTSLIRGQAISSPIPNTLLHASYSYPTAGPTPEQMAFVGSTQSLLKFGVPVPDGSVPGEAPPPSWSAAVSHSPPTTTNREEPGREDTSNSEATNATSSPGSSTTPVNLFVPPASFPRLIGRVDTTSTSSGSELPNRQSTMDSEGDSSNHTGSTPISLFVPPMRQTTLDSEGNSSSSAEARRRSTMDSSNTGSTPISLFIPPMMAPEATGRNLETGIVPIPESPSSPNTSTVASQPRLPPSIPPSSLDKRRPTSQLSTPLDEHRRESSSTMDSFATANTHPNNNTLNRRSAHLEAQAQDSGDETEAEDTIIGHQDGGSGSGARPA